MAPKDWRKRARFDKKQFRFDIISNMRIPLTEAQLSLSRAALTVTTCSNYLFRGVDMSVTSSQIRAGRALVGWSQHDLASRAHITQVTVANIENDKTAGSRSSLKAIRIALENEGVDFITNGVVRRNDYLSVWSGDDAYLRLLDDIYFSLKDVKGEALFMGADERENLPGVNDAVRKIKNAGIRLRVIIEEHNHYILGDLEDYRQIPSKFFANAVSVIYGDKYAILVTTHNEFRICLVKNEAVLKAQRGVFDFFWDNGKRPARRDVPQVY